MMKLRHPFIVAIALGVPGVGKTTVLRKLVELAEKEGVKVRVVNLGDYMLKEALKRGYVDQRDKIRYLKLRQQLELQIHAANAIIAEASKTLKEGDILVIDTHAVIKTSIGFWTGIPKILMETFKPDILIVIEASVEEILSRQQRDTSRYRKDISKPEIVKSLMDQTRTLAFAAALMTSSLVKIVENKEGKIEETARTILEALKGLM